MIIWGARYWGKPEEQGEARMGLRAEVDDEGTQRVRDRKEHVPQALGKACNLVPGGLLTSPLLAPPRPSLYLCPLLPFSLQSACHLLRAMLSL